MNHKWDIMRKNKINQNSIKINKQYYHTDHDVEIGEGRGDGIKNIQKSS